MKSYTYEVRRLDPKLVELRRIERTDVMGVQITKAWFIELPDPTTAAAVVYMLSDALERTDDE